MLDKKGDLEWNIGSHRQIRGWSLLLLEQWGWPPEPSS